MRVTAKAEQQPFIRQISLNEILGIVRPAGPEQEARVTVGKIILEPLVAFEIKRADYAGLRSAVCPASLQQADE